VYLVLKNFKYPVFLLINCKLFNLLVVNYAASLIDDCDFIMNNAD